MPVTVEPTSKELTEHLNTLILPEEAIGMLVGTDKERMYSHIAWAEDVRGIVNAIDGPQGHLIPSVCSKLPLALHMLLPASTGQTTWLIFLACVMGLLVNQLQDQLEWMDRS